MVRRAREISFCLLLILPLMLGSCGGKIVYADSKVIPQNTWELSDVASFYFENSDSLINTDVEFNIRTGSEYPFRNIFLFVTSTSPDGKSITDTLEYFLADEKGNRYGKGTGEILELDLPYKSRVFFPVKGTYTFMVRHGMRSINLPGVYDFGLRIRESEK